MFQSQNARPAQGQNTQGSSPAVCSVSTSKVPFPFLLFVHRLEVLFQLTLFAEHLQGPALTLPSFQLHPLFLIHNDTTRGASYLVMFYNKWVARGGKGTLLKVTEKANEDSEDLVQGLGSQAH